MKTKKETKMSDRKVGASTSLPLITIIIPVYNVEKYLRKCLDSVLNQTYKHLEILLVNDGSTDCSKTICDEYKKNDRRIVLINQSNKGLSEARNTGLKHMKGKYLFFLDSDDYIENNTIEAMYELMIESKSDMVMCDFVEIDASTGEKKSSIPIKSELLSSKKYLENFYKKNSWKYQIACNKLYKSSLFDNVLFPKGLKYEDCHIAHQIGFKCKRIYTTNLILYNYVILRNGSITTTNKNIFSYDTFLFLNDRCLFFYNNNENRLLNKAFREYQLYFLNRIPYVDIKSNKDNYVTQFNDTYNKISMNLSLWNKSSTYHHSLWLFVEKIKRKIFAI